MLSPESQRWWSTDRYRNRDRVFVARTSSILLVVVALTVVAVVRNPFGVLLCIAGFALVVLAVGLRPPYGVAPCLLGIGLSFEGALFNLYPKVQMLIVVAVLSSSVYAVQNFWRPDTPAEQRSPAD